MNFGMAGIMQNASRQYADRTRETIRDGTEFAEKLNHAAWNKPKEEMTMEEYRQWFRNEVSKMPVSAKKEKTWWEKRHEKIKELLREQTANAAKEAQARRAMMLKAERMGDKQNMTVLLDYMPVDLRVLRTLIK